MNGSDCNAHICDETATSTSTKHPLIIMVMVKYMFSMSRLVDRRASERDVCVCAVCNHAMHTSGAQSKEKDEHYVDNGKNKDRTKPSTT